jgi:hypothetical protein
MRELEDLQWRCLLFCTLMALEPVLMCAKIVHSHPPLFLSSCQLHSRERQSLRLRLYLRILSSSSDSILRVMSSNVDA